MPLDPIRRRWVGCETVKTRQLTPHGAACGFPDGLFAGILAGVIVFTTWGGIPLRAATGSLADSSGEAVAWGWNSNGQSNVPAGISFDAIAAGEYHSLALKSDGSLAAWGYNYYGQTTVPSGTNFTAVAAGAFHSLAMKSDGSLAGWGNNYDGEATVPSGTNFTAIAGGTYHSLALKSDGSLAGWGLNTSGQTTVPSGTNFTAISAGANYSLAMKRDGSLAAWGNSNYNVTTVPTGTNFTAISAGWYHGLALKSDGSLAGWGYNTFGQTTVPTGTNFTAVAAGGYHSLALKTDGSLAAWGFNGDGETNVPAGTFVAISGGGYHNLALRGRTIYDGDLQVDGPQTGIGSQLNRSVSVAGNLTVSATTMTLSNAPLAEVAGKLNLHDAMISGEGMINVNGAAVVSNSPNTSSVIQSNADVTVASLQGSGKLEVASGARLAFGPARSFTGGLRVNSGIVELKGAGDFTSGPLTLQGGEIRMGTGQTLQISSGNSQLWSGQVSITGAATQRSEIEFKSYVQNMSSMITARHATMRFDGSFENMGGGSLVLTEGANDIYGRVSNTGTIIVTGGATAIFYDDVIQNGTLRLSKSGSLTSTAIFLGTLSGSGAISGGGNLFLEGDLRPGNSPGLLSIDANVGLSNTTNTIIEIGGLTGGTEYDQLVVTGELVAAGGLILELVNDFTPSAGDQFDILAFGSLSGAFSTVVLPALAEGLSWQQSDSPTSLRFAVVPEPSAVLLIVFSLLLLRRRRRAVAERIPPVV